MSRDGVEREGSHQEGNGVPEGTPGAPTEASVKSYEGTLL